MTMLSFYFSSNLGRSVLANSLDNSWTGCGRWY